MMTPAAAPCRRDLGGALGSPPRRHLPPRDIYTDVICRQLCVCVCVARKGRAIKRAIADTAGSGGGGGAEKRKPPSVKNLRQPDEEPDAPAPEPHLPELAG